MAKVTTGVCRASYVHVAEKYQIGDQGEPKYSLMLLLPKSDTDTLEKLRAAEKQAAKDGAGKFGGRVPPKPKSIIKDGDGETDEGESIPEKYPERAGHWFFTVRSGTRPGVVDAQKNRIDPEEVYSGCYVRASLSSYAYNFEGNKGISFGLNNLQKVADGETFGNVGNAEDDFDVFEDDLI